MTTWPGLYFAWACCQLDDHVHTSDRLRQTQTTIPDSVYIFLLSTDYQSCSSLCVSHRDFLTQIYKVTEIYEETGNNKWMCVCKQEERWTTCRRSLKSVAILTQRFQRLIERQLTCSDNVNFIRHDNSFIVLVFYIKSGFFKIDIQWTASIEMALCFFEEAPRRQQNLHNDSTCEITSRLRKGFRHFFL